jgi:CBS domain-containing protein
MRAHQIMTRQVITIGPDSSVVEAANTMMQPHLSGLPVVSAAGKLIGIISEGDFIRRVEIETQRKRSRRLQLLMAKGQIAFEASARYARGSTCRHRDQVRSSSSCRHSRPRYSRADRRHRSYSRRRLSGIITDDRCRPAVLSRRRMYPASNMYTMTSAAIRLRKRILAAAISFRYSTSHRQRMTRRSEHSTDRIDMRILKFQLFLALILFGGIRAAVAQNAENGKRLSERWCSACHAIGSAANKFHGIPSFAAIAAKETISADMIVSFLLLPHATMPNLPLSRKDAEDVALFVIEMKSSE